ncbi:MAG: DUF5069 domain-containing protein [Nitrospinae bacterium]|nr:DUF5069 domain-containing protein [Nitrospinota bacterium]
MDLSRAFPRSPKQKMAGLVQLSRMIDKGRAYKEKKLADYIYPCPLDKIILNFLRVDADTFAKMTVEKKDEEINNWAKDLVKTKSSSEISFINEQILERKPDSEDRLQYFNEIRDKIDPSRADVNTWVDLLDLEEGRLPPK